MGGQPHDPTQVFEDQHLMLTFKLIPQDLMVVNGGLEILTLV